MSIWKKEIKRRDYLQLEIKDYPLKEFICPVSKEVFKDFLDHKETCIYGYCKEGWDWKQEDIIIPF